MVSELTSGRRARTIAEVVDIMTALDHEWNDRDGLWWFDPTFLERLDVVFANQYFDAIVRGDADPRSAPSAWLRDAFFSRLDGLTGFAGRGLLVPVVPSRPRRVPL